MHAIFGHKLLGHYPAIFGQFRLKMFYGDSGDYFLSVGKDKSKLLSRKHVLNVSGLSPPPAPLPWPTMTKKCIYLQMCGQFKGKRSNLTRQTFQVWIVLHTYTVNTHNENTHVDAMVQFFRKTNSLTRNSLWKI